MVPKLASPVLALAILLFASACGDSDQNGKTSTSAQQGSASASATPTPKENTKAPEPVSTSETAKPLQEPPPPTKPTPPAESKPTPVVEPVKPPRIEAKDFRLPLPLEAIKIDLDKALPLPEAPKANKPEVSARLAEIRKAWEAIPSQNERDKERYKREFEREVTDLMKRWNSALEDPTFFGRRPPFMDRLLVPNPERLKVSDSWDKLEADIAAYIPVLARSAESKLLIEESRAGISKYLKHIAEEIGKWNESMEAAEKSQVFTEKNGNDLMVLVNTVGVNSDGFKDFISTYKGKKAIEEPLTEAASQYGKLIFERAQRINAISQAQAKYQQALEEKTATAAEEAQRVRIAAKITNPLKAGVVLSKKPDKGWMLYIKNYSSREWKDAVVVIETTAHGSGYEVKFEEGVQPGVETGGRAVRCFNCQRKDGTRFNELFMNIKAVHIVCSEGKAVVEPSATFPE
jgi:hypothetical protein